MKTAKNNPDIPELNLIAQRLKELRKLKGFDNYEHIAFELGMSRSAYWRLESGANFELKTLIKICKLLGVTLEKFFHGINLPKEKSGKKKR
jgi:transcriptional regulator with XRE-family HTH domain